MKKVLSTAALAAMIALGAGCPESQGPGGGGQTSSGGSGGAAPAAWAAVYEGKALGGSVLAVWGSGPEDVYVVGGPLGNSGFEAIAWRFDGSQWHELSPGGIDGFWWVAGSGPNDVWMAGEHGRITHWDGQSFEDHPPLTTATIWGLWAASPTEAWAVGGTPEAGMNAPNDVVLRWDGSSWKEESLPTKLGRSLNKVWGSSATDVYAVGEAGTVWHRKGTSWSLETTPATSNLLTVHGCSNHEIYAVGGQDVLRSDGTTWSKVDIVLHNTVNGVSCGTNGDVLLVGGGGLKQRLVDAAWIDDFKHEPYGDLHGAWADGHGALWAAGGDFVSKPAAGVARKAIIGRYGPGLLPPPKP